MTAVVLVLVAALSRFLPPRALRAAIFYLAVVYLLLALAATLLATVYMAFGPSFSALPPEPGMVFGHVLFLTVFPTITVASLVSSYALLRRRPWGRWIVILLNLVYPVFFTVDLFSRVPRFTVWRPELSLVAFPLATVVFLVQPKVKGLFIAPQ